MKSLATQFVAGAVVALSAGLSGRGDAPLPASIPNPESVHKKDADDAVEEPVTSRDVKREVNEAVDAVSKYADQTREEYQAAMQKKLDELDVQIAELQAEADAASQEAEDDAKHEYEEAMATLKEKRQAMANKLTELKSAYDDAWRDVAEGVDAAWDDVSAAFKSAAGRFEAPEEDADISNPDTEKSSG